MKQNAVYYFSNVLGCRDAFFGSIYSNRLKILPVIVNGFGNARRGYCAPEYIWIEFSEESLIKSATPS